jgi:hypothetical protein
MISFAILKTLLGELGLLTVCLFGDEFITDTQHPQWLRAACDTLTHGLVGLLSWFVVVGGQVTYRTSLEMMTCATLASLVDADHFIAAKSLSLSAALSLPKRPPFHNSTLIPVIAAALYLQMKLIHAFLASETTWTHTSNLVLVFIVAWSTHHVRDATRRGLWFAPFGSTSAVPRTLYLAFILLGPLGLRFALALRSSKQGVLVLLENDGETV